VVGNLTRFQAERDRQPNVPRTAVTAGPIESLHETMCNQELDGDLWVGAPLPPFIRNYYRQRGFFLHTPETTRACPLCKNCAKKHLALRTLRT
jgi:hypothetical protein